MLIFLFKDRGPNTIDPKNPTGALNTSQMVYIKDLKNFCMNLPDLTKFPGRRPTFLEGEGSVVSNCVGTYKPAGAISMPANGLSSIIMTKNIHPNGRKYYQMYGLLNCPAIGIDCSTGPDGS
ncbi:hypothetical protein HDU96_011031 [Phlyctochytrium bullatum]|nr:hypothetical protein HDU96_011031 [Phlyctochytrium bullatum]